MLVLSWQERLKILYYFFSFYFEICTTTRKVGVRRSLFFSFLNVTTIDSCAGILSCTPGAQSISDSVLGDKSRSLAASSQSHQRQFVDIVANYSVPPTITNIFRQHGFILPVLTGQRIDRQQVRSILFLSLFLSSHRNNRRFLYTIQTTANLLGIEKRILKKNKKKGCDGRDGNEMPFSL